MDNAAATQSTASEGLEHESQLLKESSVHQIEKVPAKHPGQYTPLYKSNMSEISECLQKLGKTHIFNLGMTLGITDSKLTEMMESPSYAENVASAWLQREEERDTPTWVNLISTLTDLLVKPKGRSSEIVGAKGTTAEVLHVHTSQHLKVSKPGIHGLYCTSNCCNCSITCPLFFPFAYSLLLVWTLILTSTSTPAIIMTSFY